MRGGGSLGAAARTHNCFTDDLTQQVQVLKFIGTKSSAIRDIVGSCTLFY